MNQIETLKTYFDTSIKPDLAGLERFMRMYQYVVPLTAVAFIGLLFGIAPYVTGTISALGFVIFFATHGFVNKSYKNKIVLPLMAQLGEGFSFDYDAGLSESDLRASRLYNFYGMSKLKMSKLTTYTQNERTISMCHVSYNRQYTQADDTSKTETFKTLFFKAPTKLNIKTTTMIRPDLAERLAGHTGQMTQNKTHDGLSMIRLDSPEFEKHFIVYGEDSIEAHYLLNHTVMERILEFETTYQLALLITFTPSHLYIEIGEDWLEPHIVWQKEAVRSFDAVKKDFELIFALIALVQAIEKHHLVGDTL